jgi:exocyst complex protein 7
MKFNSYCGRRSASLSGDEQQSGNRANSTIQITLARPEDEFCNILLNHTSPIEPDSLDSTATSADPSSSSLCSNGTPSTELDDLNDEHLSEEDELHRQKDEWKTRK